MNGDAERADFFKDCNYRYNRQRALKWNVLSRLCN